MTKAAEMPGTVYLTFARHGEYTQANINDDQWEVLHKKGKRIQRKFGPFSRIYSSRSLRTIQTALAFFGSTHPAIKRLLDNRPDEISHPVLKEAVKESGLRFSQLLAKAAARTRGSERQADLQSLQRIATYLARHNVGHALFVSHSEVLKPLLDYLQKQRLKTKPGEKHVNPEVRWGEHFTLKFSPAGASLIFRGEEHALVMKQ